MWCVATGTPTCINISLTPLVASRKRQIASACLCNLPFRWRLQQTVVAHVPVWNMIQQGRGEKKKKTMRQRGDSSMDKTSRSEKGGRGGAINGDSVKIWAVACIRFTCACMRGGVHGMCVSVRWVSGLAWIRTDTSAPPPNPVLPWLVSSHLSMRHIHCCCCCVCVCVCVCVCMCVCVTKSASMYVRNQPATFFASLQSGTAWVCVCVCVCCCCAIIICQIFEAFFSRGGCLHISAWVIQCCSDTPLYIHTHTHTHTHTYTHTHIENRQNRLTACPKQHHIHTYTPASFTHWLFCFLFFFSAQHYFSINQPSTPL